MAKKNISSLLSGIMGEPNREEIDPATATFDISAANADDIPEISSSVKTEPTSTTKVTRKRGRPRNENKEERNTFMVDSTLLRKIRYIALMEDCMQKEIVNEALRHYVNSWEKRNGIIKLLNKD